MLDQEKNHLRVTPSILTLFPVGISYGTLTVTLTVKFPGEVTFSLELICVIDISFISLKVNSLAGLEFNLLKGIVDVFLKLFLNVKRSSEIPIHQDCLTHLFVWRVR